MSERCSVCASRKVWAIENAYLADGTKAAVELCEQLDISQSAFYRHLRSHVGLRLNDPPESPTALEWSRAAINLASIPEKLVVKPESVSNIAIITERDEEGLFVGLLIDHMGDALDLDYLAVLEHRFDVERHTDAVGMAPITRTLIKLHAPSVFVGRRNS